MMNGIYNIGNKNYEKNENSTHPWVTYKLNYSHSNQCKKKYRNKWIWMRKQKCSHMFMLFKKNLFVRILTVKIFWWMSHILMNYLLRITKSIASGREETLSIKNGDMVIFASATFGSFLSIERASSFDRPTIKLRIWRRSGFVGFEKL